MLNILQLHLPEDNRDARCWILARGKNLRKRIDFLQSELLKTMSKGDLINFLAEKAGVTLKIGLDDLSIKEWLSQIERLRIENKISFNQMMKITGTSGEDWIKIQKGQHLPSCKKLNKIAEVIKLKIDKKCNNDDFCLRSIDVIIKSLNSEQIPLIVISGLIDLYEKFIAKNENVKEKILDEIDKLKVLQDNSKLINAVKEINMTLAKILGAFAADGNYYPPDMLRWEEEYKEQLELLSEWFDKSFGIKLKIKPSNRMRNSFTIKFRNKIVGRYLQIFFSYKPSNKIYSVDEPSLIKQQTLDIRRAFASGALMFDGSVNLDGTVSFSVASKSFRDSVVEILKKDGLVLSISKKPNKNNWSFCTSRKLSLSHLNKIKLYFCLRTKKRQIIEFYLGNLKPDLNDLEKLFPKIKSEITPPKLLKFLNKAQNIYDLMISTRLSRQTLLRYLRVLEQSELINSQLEKGKRIYLANSCSTNSELLNLTKSE